MLVVGAIAATVWLVRAHRGVGALALGAGLALLPVVNLVPLRLGAGSMVAERFLATPLVLLVLALAGAAAAASRRAAAAAAATAAVWLDASLVTVELTIPHWRDTFTLWTWAAERSPDSPFPYINLSRHYGERGEWDLAFANADRAIKLGVDEAAAWCNRAVAQEQLGRTPEALADYEEAVRRAPNSSVFQLGAARILISQGRLEEAAGLLDQILARAPDYMPALTGRASVHLQQGRPDLAVPLLERARSAPPSQEQRDAARQLAVAYLEQGEQQRRRGDVEGALAAYRRASEAGATEDDVAFGVTSALIDAGKYDEAELQLRSAASRFPDDARIIFNVGRLARARGDFISARQHFSRAAALAPEWPPPREALVTLGGR